MSLGSVSRGDCDAAWICGGDESDGVAYSPLLGVRQWQERPQASHEFFDCGEARSVQSLKTTSPDTSTTHSTSRTQNTHFPSTFSHSLTIQNSSLSLIPRPLPQPPHILIALKPRHVKSSFHQILDARNALEMCLALADFVLGSKDFGLTEKRVVGKRAYSESKPDDGDAVAGGGCLVFHGCEAGREVVW